MKNLLLVFDLSSSNSNPIASVKSFVIPRAGECLIIDGDQYTVQSVVYLVHSSEISNKTGIAVYVKKDNI